MDELTASFRRAYANRDGYGLASTLDPESPADADQRLAFLRGSNAMTIQSNLRSALVYHSDLSLSKEEANTWIEVFAAFWSVLGELEWLNYSDKKRQQERPLDWKKAYQAWRNLTVTLQKSFQKSTLPFWSVPCMYVASAYLRVLAIKADESARDQKGDISFATGLQDDVVDAVGKHESLEDAARLMNMVFAAFASDRAPLDESRKWGLYAIVNLQFKIYFQLNAINLAKNLIRSVSVTELPPLEQYPLAHQVTFHYYCGVISFLEEDYAKAEEHLTSAWRDCSKDSPRNRALILTYLIPCHLLTSHQLPTKESLAPFPQLAALFDPLATAIKNASLAQFEAALQAGEAYFVKRRIYLTLERARDVVLRNLFRKVYLAGGFEPLKDGQTEAEKSRRTRIPIEEFVAAVKLSAAPTGNDEILGRDEVECLLANMIYKNLMKGYIHRERAITVLSKAQPFPGTTP